MQLVRLGREGHRGLRRALTDLSQDFVSRVSDERAGGAVEAQQEWDHSVDGALTQVLGEKGKFPVHPACDCLIAELRRASLDPTLFSSGTAGLTERRILVYLIEAARLGRSVLVRESQRQIAVAIDKHQPTVSRALKRLEALGWLRRLAGVDPLTPTPYLLLLPERCTDVSTKRPAVYIAPLPAGSSVDITMHAQVHRLFGSAGLGTGASIVAKQRAGIGKNLDDMMSSNCDWTMPGSVDTRPGYKTCAIQVFTINLEAHSLQMVLQGAQNPEGPASIGAPPDEIKSLVADTITAARTLESESDKANPCTAPGASADCVTILFDFARAMTAMQAQFAAWSPYGG